MLIFIYFIFSNFYILIEYLTACRVTLCDFFKTSLCNIPLIIIIIIIAL